MCIIPVWKNGESGEAMRLPPTATRMQKSHPRLSHLMSELSVNPYTYLPDKVNKSGGSVQTVYPAEYSDGIKRQLKKGHRP